MIIDSHSHLFDKPFDADRAEVIARMKSAGVATITVGTSYAESLAAVALASELGRWATVGQHPTDTFEDFDILKFRDLAKNPKVVGIGECGLDYFQSRHSKLSLDDEKARQKKLFQQHIELAKAVSKPLMLHIRDAYTDAYEILKNAGLLGTVHFFGGDWDTAKKFLDLGFTLSFPGTITFTHDYDEVVKSVPDDMFLVETDAPYVLPEPYRTAARGGALRTRNEPAYVLEVAKRIGEIRGISPERAGELATENAKRVFGLSVALGD